MTHIRNAVISVLVCKMYLVCLLDTPEFVCSIPNCDTTTCTGNDCHQCLGASRLLDLYVWTHCDPHCILCVDDYYFECSGNCKTCALETCNSTGCHTPGLFECPACPASYYLGQYNHCYPCGETGCVCSAQGTCVGCVPGKYNTSNFCIDDCPSGCAVCSNSTSCSSCAAGKYGAVCDLSCIDTRSDGTCNIDSGKCECNGMYRRL